MVYDRMPLANLVSTMGHFGNFALGLIISLTVYQGGQAQDIFPITSLHSVTKEVVDIQVTDIHGTTKPLSSILVDDRNYIVSIMASWCGPCRTELNAFQKVAEDWKCDLNTEVIAISIEKPSDTYKLAELVEKQNWTMQVVHDKMSYTGRSLGVFDIPQTFLINRQREIVYHTEGFHTNLIKNYQTELEKLHSID